VVILALALALPLASISVAIVIVFTAATAAAIPAIVVVPAIFTIIAPASTGSAWWRRRW
jgi:hypothetical protein